MKKIYAIFSLFLTLALVMPIPIKAADTDFSGKKNTWKVRFTTNKKMVSTFDSDEFNDILTQMQPGDSVVFTVDLQNLNKETTRWYMSNKVLKSLEDASSTASSGAYEYVLSYENSKGTAKEIYNSETVGGEDENGNVPDDLEGLHEATENLEDYFFLDTFKKNQGGKITLKVALDGETQGNAYQDTMAQLQMNFAVELDDTTTKKKKKTKKVRRGTVAKTGDDTDWSLYYILAAIGGIGLLALGGYSIKVRREEEGEEL